MSNKKENQKKNRKKNTNPYHKTIKNIFVAQGMYSTYTFFTIGKKEFMFSSVEQYPVYEISEENKMKSREDLTTEQVLEVIHHKTQNQLMYDQQYYLSNMEEVYIEFWEQICEEQDNDITEREGNWVVIATLSESLLAIEVAKSPKDKGEYKEEHQTYDFFGEPVAYGEMDRQLMDYHMSQGNFDEALNIHLAYKKES